jgi:hypothetical protein
MQKRAGCVLLPSSTIFSAVLRIQIRPDPHNCCRIWIRIKVKIQQLWGLKMVRGCSQWRRGGSKNVVVEGL